MTVSRLGAPGYELLPALCHVDCEISLPSRLLPAQVSSSGFLWLVGTSLESFLQERGSPWKSWSAIRLGSMLWRLHKLVSREAASFVSADSHYGLGCPEQEWANGLEKNQQWNLAFFPFFFLLETFKSAKKKCYKRRAQATRKICGSLQAV